MKLNHQPLMDKREIEVLNRLLTERKPRRLLEWGSGGSTLYWPPRFPDIQWISIEHDEAYFRAVSKECAPWVVVLHLQRPEYINLDNHCLGMFDFIIVDGHPPTRIHCIQRAKKLLTENGVVLLHDSHFPPYLKGRKEWNKVTEVCSPNQENKRGLMLFEKPKNR